MKKRSGFTLIELILTIAIIGMLATLLFPAIGSVVERAHNLKCLNNLRQIGTAALAAAADNNNRFPKVEIDRKDPIYEPAENAKTLDEAFKQFGITDKVLQCPEDMAADGPKWFLKEKTSYMWQTMADEEEVGNIKIYTPRGNFIRKQSRVGLCTDYEAVHSPDVTGGRKKMNVVYADGHVMSR